MVITHFEYGVSIVVKFKKLRVNHALATATRKATPPSSTTSLDPAPARHLQGHGSCYCKNYTTGLAYNLHPLQHLCLAQYVHVAYTLHGYGCVGFDTVDIGDWHAACTPGWPTHSSYICRRTYPLNHITRLLSTC
jgi:hypothetical protein